MLGVQPKKVGLTPDGTQRVLWEPKANTRIRFESHAEGLKPGDAGFNPRHHGEHFYIELKPDGVHGTMLVKMGLLSNQSQSVTRLGQEKAFCPANNFLVIKESDFD